MTGRLLSAFTGTKKVDGILERSFFARFETSFVSGFKRWFAPMCDCYINSTLAKLY